MKGIRKLLSVALLVAASFPQMAAASTTNQSVADQTQNQVVPIQVPNEVPTDPARYAEWKSQFGKEVTLTDPSNSFLGFVVASDGRYTMGTTGGDPDNPNDDDRNILYGHPSPWSSYTTLNIDGNTSIYTPNSGSPVDEQLSNVSSEIMNNIKITQEVSIVHNTNTDRDDTVAVHYTMTNNDSSNHDVGMRIMMDTMLGNNDAAPFRVPGIGAVTTETELTGDQIPEYWQAFDSLTNPTVASQGTFYRSANEKPDKVQFTNWSNVYNNPWNYQVQTGSYNGDSAVSVYWNPKTLAPGETRAFVTYYGLSSFTQDLRPPLALSVTGDTSVTAANDSYNPNPFTVTAYIDNIGNGDANNIKASINLPQGLHLVNGESSTLNLGTMSVGQNQMTSWQVQIDPTSTAKDLSYSVTIKADNTESKTVSRSIHVPAVNIASDEKPMVIFIPGTGGSSLYNGDEKVWVNAFNYGKLNFTDNPNLSVKDEDVYSSYDKVKPYLISKGYSEDQVAVFTYDWRDAIWNNVYKLLEFIQKKNVSKVDIVAHSQGGLIATMFAKAHPEMINKIVNVGPPYLGAPKALYLLKTGAFDWRLDYSIMQRSLATMPSVFMMLPTKKYFDYDYYYEWNINSNGIVNHLKYNNYNDMKNLLSAEYDPSLVQSANLFSDAFDSEPQGVEIWNIVGDSIGTIGRIVQNEIIRTNNQNYVWDQIDKIKTISGDETVPLLSSNRGITNQPRTYYYHGDSAHGEQMKDDDILEKVYNILSGNPDQGSDLFTTTYEIPNRLVLTINSPVDLNVYQNGKHDGPSAEYYGNAEVNIPGSSYWMIDHNKVASLKEGQYDVTLNATDTGVFSFTVEHLSQDNTDKKAFFRDIPVKKGAVIHSTVNTDVNGIELEIDENNDGVVDEVVKPTFWGEGSVSEDSQGPDIQTTVKGEKGNGNWYKSNVGLDLTATDNDGGSGVNKIYYKLSDDKLKDYQAPLIFSQESSETTQLQAFADDKMGNYSNLHSLGFRIDKTDPIITTSFQKEYQLGSKVDLSKLVQVSDAISGVHKQEIYLDNQSVDGEITWNIPGNHVLKIVAEDNAGRTATTSINISVYIPTNLVFDPKVLNGKTGGSSVITTYLQLPDGYNLNDINLSTIRLNGNCVPIQDNKGYVKNPVVDFDSDGKPEFMAKFNRKDLLNSLPKGEQVTITLDGQLTSGIPFKGTTTITVK